MFKIIYKYPYHNEFLFDYYIIREGSRVTALHKPRTAN